MVSATAVPVDGWPGYFVEPTGRLFRVRADGSEFEPKQQILAGYVYITLSSPSKRRPVRLNRIVATAFKGRPPFDRAEARHLDGDKLNNCDSNIAWGTAKDNADDRERHGRTSRGEESGLAKLSDLDVQKIRKAVRLGATGDAIAEMFHISGVNVSLIVRRETWAHVADVDVELGFDPKSLAKRVARGSAHKLSKLTKEDVFDIRRRAESGEKRACLAEEFGVSWTHINRIVRNEVWPSME